MSHPDRPIRGRLDRSAPDPSGYGATLAMTRAIRDAHLEMEQVTHARVTRVHVEPVEADAAIPVELDGETPGHLPATFEVLPGALRLRA